MLFEPRKMHQIAVQLESRNLVTHSLSRVRCRFLDGLTHLHEQGLHFQWELGDVGVYGIGDLGIRLHGYPAFLAKFDGFSNKRPEAYLCKMLAMKV